MHLQDSRASAWVVASWTSGQYTVQNVFFCSDSCAFTSTDFLVGLAWYAYAAATWRGSFRATCLVSIGWGALIFVGRILVKACV